MRVVRSGEAERAFEEAWRERGESATLVDVARRAATKGRLEEVEICLDRLRDLCHLGTDDLAFELRALVRCVRNHPSYRSRRAS